MTIEKKLRVPILISFSIAAMVMKKFAIPFSGLIVVIAFDSLAIIFFLNAFFTTKEEVDGANSRIFEFNVTELIYATCSIALLYRLQYWNGWETWIEVAGILFLITSIFVFLSLKYIFRKCHSKSELKEIFIHDLPWTYFLILLPVFAFANPHTFHNLFNGTTYEEYVREHFPVNEGTLLIEKYKPTDEKSKKQAQEFFGKAKVLEKTGEYNDALINYNKSIDYNPDDAKIIYSRGLLKLTKLELSKDMAQSAYDDFSRAIELDSTLAVAYYHRAVARNYMFPKNRLPSRGDLLKAKELDSSFNHDKYIEQFLSLPLVDSTCDTTSYVNEE